MLLWGPPYDSNAITAVLKGVLNDQLSQMWMIHPKYRAIRMFLETIVGAIQCPQEGNSYLVVANYCANPKLFGQAPCNE
jgi:hypothetical protein